MVDERLKRYEALLREKCIDPNEVPGISEAENRGMTANGCSDPLKPVWKQPQATVFKPQLLVGQNGTELVDNSLWSRVAEEVHDTEAALGGESANEASDGDAFNDDFTYLLTWKPHTLASSHPPAAVIHQLWQTFLENVNPLTKLVHVPTLQSAIEKAITKIELVPRGFEALMFAIYSMAVLSLREDECKEIIGEARAILLPRYVAATKTALSRAKFMSSTSIVVLQALVLHIMSIRDDYEPRAVWSLTGVAMRIAEGMGMRLDGALLGLSPFETEIRRRIWWQLNMHDFRAAELCGQAKFRNFTFDETTPKKPANVNDSELYPAMPQPAVESIRPTEMIWCMFRSELVVFAAGLIARMPKLGKIAFTSEEYTAMDNLKVKDAFVKELEDVIETKYLRFCDPSQPLQFMVLLGARLSTNLIRFIAHHPRRWASLDQVPVSEQQFVWGIVIQLLEQYSMMQSSSQLRRFAWNVPYFIQWHAVIHVLDTLRANPLHLDSVKAWKLIGNLYENNSELMLNMKKPIFVAVGGLCLKAFDAREAALANEDRIFTRSPEYITKLRDQREGAKARRETTRTKIKVRAVPDNDEIPKTMENEARWPDTNSDLEERRDGAQPQINPLGHTRTGDDAFWLNDALEGAGAVNMMELDIDGILSQDYWLDNLGGEVIDWEQWDAWLSNGNTDPIP